MDSSNAEEFYTKKTPPPPESGIIMNYQIKERLEQTNFSYLYLAVNIKNNQKKVLKFVKFFQNNMKQVKEEVELMKIANHPNIIKIDESFRYGAYLCIVTPYYENKDLYYFLLKNYHKGFPEKLASKIFFQMISAIKYLHDLNIYHRDIKLDNFLVADADPENTKIVLADFGMAKQFSNNEPGKEICGTIEYMAPEMYTKKSYNLSIDIWSLGISLFELLTGKLPFPSPKILPDEFKKRLKKALLNYNALKRSKISDDAIDLIHKMCTLNPSSRISAKDAINHSWLKSYSNETHNESQISYVLNQNNSSYFNTGI